MIDVFVDTKSLSITNTSNLKLIMYNILLVHTKKFMTV